MARIRAGTWFALSIWAPTGAKERANGAFKVIDMKAIHLLWFSLIAWGPAVCREPSSPAAMTGFGPQPFLPAPVKSVLPTVNIAPAKGWLDNERPTPAQLIAQLLSPERQQRTDHRQAPSLRPHGRCAVRHRPRQSVPA